jgi:hypothetical protein
MKKKEQHRPKWEEQGSGRSGNKELLRKKGTGEPSRLGFEIRFQFAERRQINRLCETRRAQRIEFGEKCESSCKTGQRRAPAPVHSTLAANEGHVTGRAPRKSDARLILTGPKRASSLWVDSAGSLQFR